MKPNPEPQTPSSMSLSFPITVMLSPLHRVVYCKPMTRTLWHHAWGSLSLVLQHWKDFSSGGLGQPSSDRRGEWSQWRRGLLRVTQEAVIKAHLHPSGLGSNAASSDDSSNSWSRWGLSALIKCSVSILYFPCLEFLTAVLNISYGNACLTLYLLLYCLPMVNRTCLAHSTSPAT